MAILSAAIGVTFFLITVVATFIWLRHRDVLKKGGRLN
jgi:hypothetical protein